ncbi:hypothetical protein AC249_AIPGENE10869 [Exaiptasia diaphana]|nr:hypothetical protein AC249_AIPGENE10869 [Exaiptasia diaphana]
MSWNYANYIKYPEKTYKPGSQKLDREQIDEIVERLNVNKVYKNNSRDEDTKKLSSEQVEKLLERIADKDVNMGKTPDRQRTGADNYFNAWKANEILGKRSLGQQKLPAEKVEAIVERLNVVKKHEEQSPSKSTITLSKEEVEDMVNRLADKDKTVQKTPDRDRTGACKQMGIVNTYAWNNGKSLRNNSRPADGNFY